MKKFTLFALLFLLNFFSQAQSSISQVTSADVPLNGTEFIVPEWLQNQAPLNYTKIYKQTINLELNENGTELPEDIASLFVNGTATAEIYYFFADEKFVKVVGNEIANTFSHGDIRNIFETNPQEIKDCGAEFSDCIERANSQFRECTHNQSGSPGIAVCYANIAISYITCAGLCVRGVVVGAYTFIRNIF